VLARMDAAAASFRGMTAKVVKTSFTAIIKDTIEESGTMTLRSPKARQVHALIQFEKPDRRSIAFRDKRAQIYLPKINTVQEYDLGKYNDLLTQGLLIGFATPAREIRKGYSVAYTGEATVGGSKCWRLELLPRIESVKQHISKIELWIDQDSGQPVQQKLHQSSGDYTQIQYSGMKLEPNLTDAQVQLALPPNVKREYPQK
jgi:outer membrane lipoprotein-sorting protein